MLTIEDIQKMTPEEIEALNKKLAKKIALNLAISIAVPVAVHFGLKFAVNKLGSSTES